MATLREKQKALARREILQATAELVSERRMLDFSVQEVATAAGVSLRTVYNHFETRQDLLIGLTAWWAERVDELGAPSIHEVTHLDEIVQAVQTMFRINDELGGISDAYARVDITDQKSLDPDRDVRTEGFTRLAQADLPNLDPDVARNVGLLIRNVSSQRTWWSLTRDFGMDPIAARHFSAWAVKALIDAARQGVTLPATEPTRDNEEDP